MTLLAVQQVLSRVLTDPPFRAAFFADPSSASGAYELTPRELASLARLDRERVASFAFMLAHERVHFALTAFPAAATLLRPLRTGLADRFAREFPPVPTALARLESEAARFAALVRRLVAAGEVGPAYLGDVVAFELAVYELFSSEAAWAAAQEAAALRRGRPDPPSLHEVLASVPVTGPHVALSCFDHDVVDLTARLRRGETPEGAPRCPTIILLTRTVEPPAIARSRVNPLTRDLLERCDGRRTGEELVGELADRAAAGPVGRGRRDRLAHRTGVALRRLWEAGAVGLHPAEPTSVDGGGGGSGGDHRATRRPVGEAILAGRRERS